MVQYHPPKDWEQWVGWLAAGLHGRNRWRLSLISMGMVFARGRRTVTSWLRAVGVTEGFASYYYFLQPVGIQSKELADRLLVRLVDSDRVLLAVDDSPTQRYGPKVQGAGIHHHPTPGPADQKFLYGHIWVTISLILRHPLWRTLGLPLIGLLYVRDSSGDHRGVPRPSGDRARLSRRQGGLGSGPATGAPHLGEHRRLQSQPLGPNLGVLGLAQAGRRNLQPRRLSWGRPGSPSVPCRSTQSLAPPDAAK